MSSTPPVNAAGASGFAKFVESVGNGFKWMGRGVVHICKEYIWPALQAIGAFLRTGYGLAAIAGSVGVLLLSLGFQKPAESISPDEKGCLDNLAVRVGLVIAGVGCFIGAGILLASGTAALI